MAQAGFSGEPRYALPGAALIAVAGAAGLAAAARGRPLALAAAAALVALAAAPRLADLPGLRADQAYQWRLASDLGAAVATVGGRGRRARLRAARTSGPLRGPLMAYRMDVEKRRVEPDAAPRAPGVVFRSALSAGGARRARRAAAGSPGRAPRRLGGARGVPRWTSDLGCPKMPRRCARRHSSLPLAALALAGCGDDELADLERPAPATEQGGAHHFDVERIASGLEPPGLGRRGARRPARAVGARAARPRRADRGRRPPRDACSTSPAQVLIGAEQGLLGIAFHPDFARNGRLFLHWSDRRGDTRVAEFHANADHTIRERPVRQLLMVDQPEENHNGGQLAFGPDGRLYLGLGDGGGAFDPRATAQDPRNLLGKLIAVDVDEPQPRWQVVLTGLRNPWRFWFDPALGEVWIGDVGQDEVEEIDRVPLELDEPPKNLGWSAFEGTHRIDGHDLDRTRRPRLARRAVRARRRRRLLGHRRRRLRRRRAARRWSGATSTATSAPARCGRCAARPPAARRTSGASGRTSRSSRTSAPTPTASSCSRPAPGDSTARCRPAAPERAERGDGPVEPDAHVVARVPGGEAEPAAAQPQAARELELDELVVAVERAADDERRARPRRAPSGARSRPTRAGSRACTSPLSPAATAKRPSSQSAYAVAGAAPGSTSASPRNSATQCVRGRS